MKVRVSYTVEVTDSMRRGMNIQYGRMGLASREAVKDWYMAYGSSMDTDIPEDDFDEEDE